MDKPMSIKEKLAMEAAQQGQVGAVQPGDGVNPPVPGRTVAAFPAPAVPGPPPPPPAPKGQVAQGGLSQAPTANMTGPGAPPPPPVQTTIFPPNTHPAIPPSVVEAAKSPVPVTNPATVATTPAMSIEENGVLTEMRVRIACALIRATAGNITPAKAASEADKYLKALIG